MKLVKIDGQSYDFEQMSDDLKAQVASLQAAESKLSELKRDAALIMSARGLYLRMLKKNLANVSPINEPISENLQKRKTKK